MGVDEIRALISKSPFAYGNHPLLMHSDGVVDLRSNPSRDRLELRQGHWTEKSNIEFTVRQY